MRVLLAVLAAVLVACGVEDLPDAPKGPGEHAKLPAHPEYQFLWKLGAPEPLPHNGYEALGRRVTDMGQLVEIAHLVTHEGCPEPQHVDPAQLDDYLTPAMAEALSAAAVCDHGNGDIVGLVKPGGEARFEAAYRAVPEDLPARWREAAAHIGRECCDDETDGSVDYWAYHPLRMGNGFIVFKIMNSVAHTDPSDDEWSKAGAARLLCKDGPPPQGKRPWPLDLRTAVTPGCYLAVRHR